ncbi:hypothetical protein PO909_001105 [Leuciscus waleckii]
MKFICLTLLLVSGITDSRSEQYTVVGPADPVFAVAGEEVILPCSVKPSISVVDMRVEWFRLDLKDSPLVHLYDDHEDRNTDQIQSYRGRTKLIHEELQRGNASLKLSTVRVSDEGRYKCFIQSKSWSDDATIDVRVEAVGRPPVITVDGFDRSGGLHLLCESEGWNPEPDLEWLDSEGVSLSSETTETHRNTEGFSLKHTITVYHSDDKIHCRVKLKHHMLETLINTTTLDQLQDEHRTLQNEKRTLQDEHRKIQHERDKLLQSQKIIFPKAVAHLRTHTVKVTLDADTAHRRLIVSHDGKQVKYGNTLNAVDEVKDQTEWDLGVTRESSKRSGISLSPDVGYWTVGWLNKSYWARDSTYVSLSLRVKPQRVGVFVDYDQGLVFFYEMESMFHIYTYTDQSFKKRLYPYVGLGYQSNENSTPLIICDD